MRIDPLRPGPRPRARRDEEGGAPSSKEAKEKVRLGPGGALRRTMSTCAGTSEQLRSNNAQTPGKTRHHQGPEDEARHYERRPCTVCKTSIPGSNPGGASIFRRNSPDSAGACLAGHSLLLRKALELLLTPKSDFCKALHRDELSACDRRRGGGSEDLLLQPRAARGFVGGRMRGGGWDGAKDLSGRGSDRAIFGLGWRVYFRVRWPAFGWVFHSWQLLARWRTLRPHA